MKSQFDKMFSVKVDISHVITPSDITEAISYAIKLAELELFRVDIKKIETKVFRDVPAKVYQLIEVRIYGYFTERLDLS